jgi:hypothetical protein
MVNFQEFERVIMVSKSQPENIESERDYILDASLQQIKRVMDSDIEV